MRPNNWAIEKGSAPVHIKICWRPTWELHYVHLAALGFHWASSIQQLWHCPALVLALSWQRPKRELTLAMERGIFHYTNPHGVMCWVCGNGFYQAVRHIYGNGEGEGRESVKMYQTLNLLFQKKTSLNTHLMDPFRNYRSLFSHFLIFTYRQAPTTLLFCHVDNDGCA